MSDLTWTESLIARVYPADMDIAYNVVIASGSTIAGHSVFQQANGAYALTDASFANRSGFRGILLETTVASGVVSLLRRGVLYGYDLSGVNADAPIYLSNTAGTLSSVAGDNSVIVGRVVTLTTPTLEKVIEIDCDIANVELG